MYPKMGETQRRAAYELDQLYAKDFPFVDYGIDLETMTHLQQGKQVLKFRENDPDIGLVSKEEKEHAEEKLA